MIKKGILPWKKNAKTDFVTADVKKDKMIYMVRKLGEFELISLI